MVSAIGSAYVPSALNSAINGMDKAGKQLENDANAVASGAATGQDPAQSLTDTIAVKAGFAADTKVASVVQEMDQSLLNIIA